ncbi:MAG: hypothetical protein GY720_06265 [bacterium]|nr:hypothetical protein [bacterium]
MKREDKERYLEDYQREINRGEPYFPRYALRDAAVGLALVLVLMALSAWAGAPLDERADPLATDYVPRPEWYFFFLFQLLKYFTGDLEVIGIVVIPTLGVAFLVLLPFLDRSRFRHFRRRPLVTGTTVALLTAGLALTLIAVVEAPPAADAAALTFEPASSDGAANFVTHCAACHGEFGEGALNPAQPGDIIPPISTAEYLGSRTDELLRVVVADGLPDFGMPAFDGAHGGPLQENAIDGIVAHMRSWETNPPVQLDGSVAAAGLSNSAQFLFPELCSRCHGDLGAGGSAPSLAAIEFQQSKTNEQLFDSINLGHEATPMVAWGEVLSQTQIEGLVELIRSFGEGADPGTPRYNIDVLPIFEVRCAACHGIAGGWDASTWELAVGSGDNAPVVIPGDAANSTLAQMMLGTHPDGILMPPEGRLPDALLQLVIDWIEGGALE